MSPRRGKKTARANAPRSAKKKSPARKKPATRKRAVKKAAVGRVAVKKAAVAKRVVKKRAVKKAAPKPPAKKTAAGSTPRRTARLRLVKRPEVKPVRAAAAKKPRAPKHQPFGGAIAGASAKDLALFDLVRARVEVQAAVQGMLAASAETPIAEGKWSPRQIVLHLYYWDREMLPYVEKAYLHGERPPHTMERVLKENETSQEKLAGHDWEVARRLMQQSREAFLEAVQSLPEEPAEMWSGEHALGWLIRLLSRHDRHHAAAIKEARSRTAKPS